MKTTKNFGVRQRVERSERAAAFGKQCFVREILFQKRWLVRFASLATALQIFAAPACPEPYEAEHPDGGTRVFRLRGDEFFSWEEDDTGAKFTRGKHGRLEHLKQLGVRSEELGVIQPTSNVFTPLSAVAGNAPLPRKLLVIVVEFSDIAPTSSHAFWEERFFGTTGKTVNAYYKAVSKNHFYYEPAFSNGVVFVTLASSHPNPPSNTSSNADTRKAASDALVAASALVDFSKFDTDKNGVISREELALVFILAGYESSIGGLPTPKVWGHHTSLATPPKLNGVTVGGGGYSMVGERHGTGAGVYASIGILCHELGHSLGMQDLYDTSEKSYGVGGHCLMGYGSWGARAGEAAGTTPVFPCAFLRVKVGFATAETVLNDTRNVTAASLATIFDTEILKVATANPTEYFLVENRQLSGFDE